MKINWPRYKPLCWFEFFQNPHLSKELWNLIGIAPLLPSLLHYVQWTYSCSSESRNVRVQNPDCDNRSWFFFHWLQWGKSSILHQWCFQSKRPPPNTTWVLKWFTISLKWSCHSSQNLLIWWNIIERKFLND